MKIFLIGDKSKYGGMRRKANPPGFSLIEMLVVVVLFSLAMMIIGQIFASFNRLHRKIANRALLSEDLRFATELLVRAARNQAISYSPAPLPHDSQLRLVQASGDELIVKRSEVGDAACADLSTVACLLMSTDGGVSWAPLTGKRVHVEQFDVYVYPTQSPFAAVGGSYPNNAQPFATFVIQARYMADRLPDQVVGHVQTTVSSRVYLR